MALRWAHRAWGLAAAGLVLMGLVAGCESSCTGRRGKAPQQPAEGQGDRTAGEITIFLAELRDVQMVSDFSGRAVAVNDIDPGWVVSLRIVRVRDGSAFQAGQTINFIIHSPSRDLAVDRRHDIGQTLWCKYTVSQHQDGTPFRSLCRHVDGP